MSFHHHPIMSIDSLRISVYAIVPPNDEVPDEPMPSFDAEAESPDNAPMTSAGKALYHLI